MTRALPSPLKADLRNIVQERPEPNIYGLLSLSGRRPSGRLDRPTKSFFLSEVNRPAKMEPTIPGLGKDRLESLIRILSILESDAQFCTREKRTEMYTRLRNMLRQKLVDMKRKHVRYRVK